MLKVFDYKCKECEHVDEYWYKAGEESSLACTKCQSTELIKLQPKTRFNWPKGPYEKYL